jgi:hypothetical protein
MYFRERRYKLENILLMSVLNAYSKLTSHHLLLSKMFPLDAGHLIKHEEEDRSV